MCVHACLPRTAQFGFTSLCTSRGLSDDSEWTVHQTLPKKDSISESERTHFKILFYTTSAQSLSTVTNGPLLLHPLADQKRHPKQRLILHILINILVITIETNLIVTFSTEA